MMDMPVVLLRKELLASTLQLGGFAVYLLLYGWNVATSMGHHRELVGYEPETDALLMQAPKRLSKPVVKKHPLSARILRGVFGRLNMSQSGHKLVWGLLLIG